MSESFLIHFHFLAHLPCTTLHPHFTTLSWAEKRREKKNTYNKILFEESLLREQTRKKVTKMTQNKDDPLQLHSVVWCPSIETVISKTLSWLFTRFFLLIGVRTLINTKVRWQKRYDSADKTLDLNDNFL